MLTFLCFEFAKFHFTVFTKISLLWNLDTKTLFLLKQESSKDSSHNLHKILTAKKNPFKLIPSLLPSSDKHKFHLRLRQFHAQPIQTDQLIHKTIQIFISTFHTKNGSLYNLVPQKLFNQTSATQVVSNELVWLKIHFS